MIGIQWNKTKCDKMKKEKLFNKGREGVVAMYKFEKETSPKKISSICSGMAARTVWQNILTAIYLILLPSTRTGHFSRHILNPTKVKSMKLYWHRTFPRTYSYNLYYWIIGFHCEQQKVVSQKYWVFLLLMTKQLSKSNSRVLKSILNHQ